MRVSGVLSLLVLAFVALFFGSNAYNLAATYQGNNFFQNFNFFNGGDPTHGYVYYTTQQQAQDWGFIASSNNNVYIGADHSSISSGSGRGSVRLQSNQAFSVNSLIVLDVQHMPEGCGTWPAFWMVGPNWPNQGEIDIIEGVNNQLNTQTTLHTNGGCSQSSEDPGSFTGSWAGGPNGPSNNCDVNAPGQYANAGCGIISNNQIYGTALNNMGGGVYATQWAWDSISVWFFPRNAIPGDIQSNNPNPAGWGRPYARFGLGGNCPQSHFSNLNIVINLTFCGDWAGSVFGQMCGGDCVNFVQNNPGAFADAYWIINSIKIYTQ